MLHFSLRKDAYLFLGPSETLGDIKPYFESVNDSHRIFRKKISTRIVDETMPPFNHERSTREPALNSEQLARKYQRNQSSAPNQRVIDGLINDYVPACIVLSSDLDVLHVYGDVSLYTRKLQAGRFSSNIADYIHPQLKVAVATATSRALAKEESVLYERVQLSADDGRLFEISLRVRFFKGPINHEATLALLLSKNDNFGPQGEVQISNNLNDQVHQHIQDLELRLQHKRERLQATVEELETTNEELQSSNEELLAANEELQSTNEELQSVNEELYTVNSEYQEKIEELIRAHSDLDNILNSIDIGIVVLDSAMLIRHFSPAAKKFINFLPTDIGRPFHHISNQLNYQDIINDINKVIEDGEAIEKNIETNKKQITLVKLSNYYDSKNTPQGCVITITDIDELQILRGKFNDNDHQ